MEELGNELTQIQKDEIATKLAPRLAKMDLTKCDSRISSIQSRLQDIQSPKVKVRLEERLRLIQAKKVELEK